MLCCFIWALVLQAKLKNRSVEMTRKEYYEYCFECECNGEIPLSFEDASPN